MRIGPASLLLALIGSITLHAQTLFRYPVVGGVTDRSAIVAVWLEAPGNVVLEYSLDPSFGSSLKTPAHQTTNAGDNVTKFELTGLLADSRYHYRVVDGTGRPVSKGFSFTTFPTEGSDAPVTILFGSCNRSSASRPGRTFKAAEGLDGDYFVHLGDWSYVDNNIDGYPAEPGTLRESYAFRLDTTYQFVPSILSNMGIAYEWDDHDFAGNNGHGRIPASLKDSLLAAYRRYLPAYPQAEANGGIWHSFRMGNAEIFMLDSRLYRNPVDSAFRDGKFVPPPGHSMLEGVPGPGFGQRAWLLEALRRSTARWKIIASQVPFNPSLGLLIPAALLVKRPTIARETAEYWVGYPADVDSLKKVLQSDAGRNTLIISGAVHNNLYDDGTNSIVPEFVAANLDIPNSHLYDTLKRYGVNVFKGGQSNSLSTIGRIRIETEPRNRLIVESFDENGEQVLQYVMEDESSGVQDVPLDPTAQALDARILQDGVTLRIDLREALRKPARLSLYDANGKLALDREVEERDRTITLQLPPDLPSGAYAGRVHTGDEEVFFKVIVVR